MRPSSPKNLESSTTDSMQSDLPSIDHDSHTPDWVGEALQAVFKADVHVRSENTRLLCNRLMSSGIIAEEGDQETFQYSIPWDRSPFVVQQTATMGCILKYKNLEQLRLCGWLIDLDNNIWSFRVDETTVIRLEQPCFYIEYTSGGKIQPTDTEEDGISTTLRLIQEILDQVQDVEVCVRTSMCVSGHRAVQFRT